MWIDSNFMEKLSGAMKSLSKGELIDSNEYFKEYNSEKYLDVISGFNDINTKFKNDREDIEVLLQDSNMMNEAAKSGELDKRIDPSAYNNDDFQSIVNGVNDTMETTVSNLRLVGNNLDKLSNGDFQANITENMEGDYTVLKDATNNLGKYLNFLIEDSNEMNQSAREGNLDVRIDASKYQGDFAKITNGINDTMEINTEVLGGIRGTLEEFVNDNIEARIVNTHYKGEFLAITSSINSNLQNQADDTWTRDGIAQLNRNILSKDTLQEQVQVAISEVSRYVDAGAGGLYLYDNDSKLLKLRSSFAYVDREELSNSYSMGSGVVGQVALEQKPILLKNIKREDRTIATATTDQPALNTYTYPLVYKGELLGVIEVASHEIFTETKKQYFENSAEALGSTLYASIQADKTKELLVQSQQQAEELEESTQRLNQQNEELEEQRQQMEEQNQELEVSKSELESQKTELEATQKEVQKRATELEDSNKYKSEFLANMSHELRTPLNSINILSKIIEDNRDGNLTGKQVEQAKTINQSGKDLLQLINDILDLSKIEARMMSLNLSDVHVGALLNEVHSMFEPLTSEKEINLNIDIDENLEKIIYTDKEKIRQVMKNFLSNALKFTDRKGTITIKASKSNNKELPVKLSIVDSGIGIAKDKIQDIFAAFKQADGSTSRKYGGTGLGLSISKELSQLLGGKIEVESKENEGSTFSLLLPGELNTDHIDDSLIDVIKSEDAPETSNNIVKKQTSSISDDRHDLKKNDKSILIIEDDENFAKIVRDEANDLGLKAIVALNGDDGFNLAKKYLPSGIILDMHLPIMDGWDVLKLLKDNINTRHIPVKIISADEPNIATKRMGAVEYIQKPVEPDQLDNILNVLISKGDKSQKDLLIVEDDENLRESLVEW